MTFQKQASNYINLIFVGLVFFSILPYAGTDAWAEAVTLSAIFALAFFFVFRRHTGASVETNRLLAPVLAIAVFSFVQGVVTFLIVTDWLSYSPALPESFDITASFWCALKFLAFAVFIKIALDNSHGSIRLLIWGLILTGNFFAAFGIARFLLQAAFPDAFGSFFLPRLRHGIGFGTFINQNHFAFLMLMNLGLNAALCISGKLEKYQRLLLLGFSLLTWTAIVLTASRGGIISSFVVLAVLILLSPIDFYRKKSLSSPNFSIGKRLACVTSLAVAAIFGTILVGQERVVQRFEEIPEQLEIASATDSYRRLEVWTASASMIAENKFYGIGFGGFRYAISKYLDVSGVIVPQQAHNDYLELAASGGLIGVLCGAWFLFNLLSILLKRFSESPPSFEQSARIGAVSAFAGIAVHSFFDFGLQLVGNWLFFAALLIIVVFHENNSTKNDNGRFDVETVIKISVIERVCKAAFFGVLSIVCLIFGYTRYENSLFVTDNDSLKFTARAEQPKIFFDSEFYAVEALVAEREGDLTRAAFNLERAIHFRPRDYVLQLKYAQILASQNQNKTAENYFRQAIELAPRYAAPHFEYGRFLVSKNRNEEGFAELRFAFRRHRSYFAEAFRLAWLETGGDAESTIHLLSPLDSLEKEMLVALLLDKEAYRSIAAATCRKEDLNVAGRDSLITKLLEKRQFFYANLIYKQSCDFKNGKAVLKTENLIVNGDFETDDLRREGLGFGWCSRDLPETVNVDFERETASERSLKIIFAGDSDPLLPIVSQTIVVEKKQRYQLSFSFRTGKILSGGLPVVRLIAKKIDANDELLKEIKLAPTGNDWTKLTAEIQIDNRAEALEISIARQSCKDSRCPIFGELWFDNFILKR